MKAYFGLIGRLRARGWTEDIPLEGIWRFSKKNWRIDLFWNSNTVKFWRVK